MPAPPPPELDAGAALDVALEAAALVELDALPLLLLLLPQPAIKIALTANIVAATHALRAFPVTFSSSLNGISL